MDIISSINYIMCLKIYIKVRNRIKKLCSFNSMKLIGRQLVFPLHKCWIITKVNNSVSKFSAVKGFRVITSITLSRCIRDSAKFYKCNDICFI